MNLEGYSPWGHKDLDLTEWLSTPTHAHTSPLPPPTIHVMYQCSKTGRWLHKGLEIVITAKLYPVFLRFTIWVIFSGANFYSWMFHVSSVQSLSRVQLFASPWIAACQASLSIINSWSLLKLMPIKSVMPSSHLILCRPLLLSPIPPSIRVFSNKSTLGMRWPKYWSFSFSISPSNEHPGLIFFRMDWLNLLTVQGTLKSLL